MKYSLMDLEETQKQTESKNGWAANLALKVMRKELQDASSGQVKGNLT